MGADPWIVTRVDVRKAVVTIAIVVCDAFCRELQHLWRLTREVREAPTVMQSFISQVVVAELSTNPHQLAAEHLGLVIMAVPRCVQIQSPGRLKQLRARVHLSCESLCLLEGRSRIVALRSFLDREGGTELELRIELQPLARFEIGYAICFGERGPKIGDALRECQPF